MAWTRMKISSTKRSRRTRRRRKCCRKGINELQSTEIEVDVETGDEETDGETALGSEEDGAVRETVLKQLERTVPPQKEHHYEKILNGMTKDEQKDTLERLEELVARHPGRALELHQKLSSPSRRRTIPDTVKRFQARQAKASEKREQLKMEKAQKLRELLKKVDEVKAAKDKLIEDRRQRLEMKLKRAAENRNLHLKEIMRKAHDEEEKLKEIAFINELEAQNKRHDFMTQCQEQEDRLQGIHEERQRKQEEKAAKEAAVEERRKALEAERQVKLEKMQERQRKRDEQADKKKQEKEKERQELAREKARDRSERLEALHAAQLEAQEELQKKIQQKQEEYARRHEENIEQIRQKALELSILKCSDDVAPKLAPYETQKLCNVCNVLIASEVYLLSHLRGRKHQEGVKTQNGGKDMTKEEIERYNLKIIVNAPADKINSKMVLDRERAKSFKKKCKKIRLRMNSKGEEYLSKLGTEPVPESQNKVKLKKCLKDIGRIVESQGKGRWSDNAVTALERAMGEIRRTFEKEDVQDKEVFRTLNGFSMLCNILQLDIDVPNEMPPYLPQKCYVTACATFLGGVSNSVKNSKYIVNSNKMATLLDLLLKHLVVLVSEGGIVPSVCSSPSTLPVDPIASAVMRVITKILSQQEVDSDDYSQRLQDVIR
ncbi:UNVERIFIED_CONTAM: hypothetical protein PYX00_000716 [Menopon gallinae]|uniref:U1-type domain-containing protein n=1 Tax=Menopon gallinae TaxID=328185 RepID=A0AAW2IBM8_9NEOP